MDLNGRQYLSPTRSSSEREEVETAELWVVKLLSDPSHLRWISLRILYTQAPLVAAALWVRVVAVGDQTEWTVRCCNFGPSYVCKLHILNCENITPPLLHCIGVPVKYLQTTEGFWWVCIILSYLRPSRKSTIVLGPAQGSRLKGALSRLNRLIKIPST